MSRRQKAPLHPLTEEEKAVLEEVSNSRSLPWVQVSRAKALLAVSEGQNFTQAAHSAGYKLGDSVADWVSRFNREGLTALEPKHGGGPVPQYTAKEKQRILAELQRTPQRAKDGTATWSLETLKRALRKAEDGLPHGGFVA